MTEENKDCCMSWDEEQDNGCKCEHKTSVEKDEVQTEAAEAEAENLEEQQTVDDLKLVLEEKEIQLRMVWAELQKEKNIKEELISRFQRLQAEFDNYRRRTQAEKEELATVAIQGFLVMLLPVVDNFERALGVVNGVKDIDSFREGIEMIYKQLINVLREEEVFPIESVGQPFDPNKHEAFMVEESDDIDPNIVLEEFKKGYEYKGKVIRPSMVKVSQKA
jgi:molecular chaperone GrpE